MATSSARLHARDLHLQEQCDAMFEAEKVLNINDMWDKLSKERLPSGYLMVKIAPSEDGQFVITIRMEELDEILGLPIIRRNVTIYPDLHYRMHVAGAEISVCKASKLTTKSGTFCNTTEVLNVLARLKTIHANSRDIMLSAADLLDQVSKEGENEEAILKCQFAAEQLRLVSTPPNRRRYSPMLMNAAMVWDRTSAKLYDDLYTSSLLVLPHRSTLRRLTSALNVKEGLEAGTIKYLQLRISKLNPRERLINLAMDEVYTA